MRLLLTFGLLIVCLLQVRSEERVQTGKASYYAKRITGALTASGERLHHDSMTCAHRTYPFGTRLKVTNLTNGKTVIVRVNDRGPYSKGRIIDLSWGAAKKIDMLTKGIVMVTVEKAERIVVPFKPNDEYDEVPDIRFGFDEEDIMDATNSAPVWMDIKEVQEKPAYPYPEWDDDDDEGDEESEGDGADDDDEEDEQDVLDLIDANPNASRVAVKRSIGK